MEAVFFDIDDTLYDQGLPFAHAVRAVLGTLPASTGDLYKASRLHSGEVFDAYARGSHPTDAIYVRRMKGTLAEFGIALTDGQAREMQRVYASRSAEAMELAPAMAGSLDWCAGHARAGVGVITNGSPRMQRAKLAELGCYRWIRPEDVFISEELGMAKPDPALFWHACDVMGVRPEGSLFVGDAYAVDVVGARNAGMPMVWFNHRDNPVPDGPDDARAKWVVRTDEELLALLRRIV